MYLGIGLALRTTGAAFAPSGLFAGGQDGAWFDQADMDSGGINGTWVSPLVVGLQVGLRYDKHIGGRGAEGASTSGFDSVLIGGPAFTNYSIMASKVVGKYYEVTFTVSNYAGSGGIGVGGGWVNNPITEISANGVWKETLQAADTGAINIFTRSTNQCTFTNVSVKEVPGNHILQMTDAARPTLFSGPLRDAFAGTDDGMRSPQGGGSAAGFFLCVGLKPTGGAASVRTIWSDRGTNTGYRVALSAANKLELSAGNGTVYTTIASAADVTVDTAYVLTAWDDATNLNVQINQGAVASVARPVVVAGTAAFEVGKDNAAATSFLIGAIHNLVYRKAGGVSAADRALTQKFVAARTGVTL